METYDELHGNCVHFREEERAREINNFPLVNPLFRMIDTVFIATTRDTETIDV